MPMTKRRKSLQDKLRRKFKWSTNTNYNRGTTLIKQDSLTHLYHNPRYVVDLSVYIDDFGIRQEILGKDCRGITIELNKYNVRDDGSYIHDTKLTGYIGAEELELIYRILKEKESEVCAMVSKTV